MANPPPTLSLIIPCYKEAHRMDACAEGVRRAVAEVRMETEVILVDDGSDDGTADAARNSFSSIPAFRVLDRAHGGKGAALKAGVAVSEGDCVFLAEADWSMPPGASDECAMYWRSLRNADLIRLF
jgi:glycosyltransferase involved in cell wall biosynthesis